MSESAVHVFNHHAMATFFQVRIADEEKSYAAQAARAAFDLVDQLENLLSRFRPNSEVSQAVQLLPGQSMRISQSFFECLEIACGMEFATQGAFSITPDAVRQQSTQPRWHLDPENFTLHCESGRLEFDLGAIGKGFALDQIAMELTEWDCPSYLLVAGGSSILAGAPPTGREGWLAGLGEGSEFRFALSHCSLSGSGFAVKGAHILDPRNGNPASVRNCAWAMANTAAVSDALSTACMVLETIGIVNLAAGNTEWLIALKENGQWLYHGSRPFPPRISEGENQTG